MEKRSVFAALSAIFFGIFLVIGFRNFGNFKKMSNAFQKNSKIVILLGAPGSGKGTIAQHLIDKYNVLHFSTGNLLRNEIKNETEIGKEVKSILGSGGLVSDDVVNRVVESNIRKELDSGKVVLLDGYPRTVEQAKFLDSMLGKEVAVHAVELDVDHEAVVERISKRRVCGSCGGTFTVSADMKVCPRCGGELVQRADDNEAVVRQRLAEYVASTLPVSGYYADRLIKVSGNASPEEVARNVDNVFRDLGLVRE